MAAKHIKVTLVEEPRGPVEEHPGVGAWPRAAPPHQTVEVADTPQNRGMIDAASHLLKVTE